MADEWARKRERQPVGETGLSLSLSTSPMRGESARKRYRVPLQAGFGSTRPRERTPLPARPAGERFHIFFLQARRAVSFGSAARGSSVCFLALIFTGQPCTPPLPRRSPPPSCGSLHALPLSSSSFGRSILPLDIPLSLSTYRYIHLCRAHVRYNARRR